ncbi:MAG: 3'(2'),5'-bisphosphate nucleotidase CysQ, partial [Eubacteriales bacterium]
MDSQIKLEEILEVCCDLAIRAGEEIMEVYNDQELFTQVEKKEDDSPLTMADKRANDVIITGLRQCYPNFAILSEEEKDDKSRRENPFCFIVDPLDGTKEFIKRNGEFTVNIALAQDQRVILGVVFVPATGDLYYAADRIGSFHKE